jgi:ribonuclease BN (tRNA processing enzyme)
MYNTGSVGDCLLYLFKADNAVKFTMLVDCGGIKTTSQLITPCIQDIKAACGGTIDLLVITHQHEDHLSGFNLGRDEFDKIAVRQTWMSWVEDKSDPVGQAVKTKYGKKLKQLKAAAEKSLQNVNKLSASEEFRNAKKRLEITKLNLRQTLDLISFETGASHGPKQAAGRRTNDDAMEYTRNKGKIAYRVPGEVLKNIPGAEGIKFYILGPPRDKDLKYLKIETDKDEMYHLKAAEESDEAVDADSIVHSGILLADDISPFADYYQEKGHEKSLFMKKYNSDKYKWRQIEIDSEDDGSQTALALTRLTNNTSLAIALEFENSGKVILLPADAQSGNWIGWHKPDVMKSLKDGGGKNTDELLANTVFYKVGHHGSHNGTASKIGLEKITGRDLVAFMPLVLDKVPSAWGGAANFPADKLYGALIAKTKGRLVRTDQGMVTDERAVKVRKLLSKNETADFKKNFREGSCYFEYTVDGK